MTPTPIVPAMKPSASEALADKIAAEFEHAARMGGIWTIGSVVRETLKMAEAAGFRRDPGWIACSERMPLSDHYVIAHSPKHGVVPLVAAWDPARNCWFDYTGDFYELLQITHWQPLPPAPGDNAKAREGKL